MPCDRRGTPVGPALLYDDRRAAGDPALAGAPALARVGWLARHRPAERYLHVSDVVLAALDTAAARRGPASMVRTRHRVEPDERERSVLEASYARFHAALVSRGWLDGD